MKNQHRKTFFMFLMAFLVAFFIVSLVEVLRSSFTPSGAPEIQMASAVAAVANGGVLMKPFIVDEIVNEKGTIIKKNYPTIKRRVISEDCAKLLTSLLIDVVENGTGQPAIIKGYSIAGKTGTSQKYIPGEGYSHAKFISSFVGYAPAYDPKVVVLLMVDEPHGAYYGAQVAAPSFRNIVEKTLRYLEIPPQQDKKEIYYATK